MTKESGTVGWLANRCFPPTGRIIDLNAEKTQVLFSKKFKLIYKSMICKKF